MAEAIALAEAQRIARAEVDRCLAFAAERWTLPLAPVPIYWDKRGMAAGSASCPHGRDAVIRMNPQLAAQGVQAVVETAAHEAAHVIVTRLYRLAWERNPSTSRPDPHGRAWQYVMRALGHRPERCHSFDFAPARTTERHEYRCGCESPLYLGPKRHARAQRHFVLFGRTGYSCRVCKQRIVPA